MPNAAPTEDKCVFVCVFSYLHIHCIALKMCFCSRSSVCLRSLPYKPKLVSARFRIQFSSIASIATMAKRKNSLFGAEKFKFVSNYLGFAHSCLENVVLFSWPTWNGHWTGQRAGWSKHWMSAALILLCFDYMVVISVNWHCVSRRQ